jgi:carboxymethylenebutenolidase
MMPYEAMLAETVLMKGHRGDQIDAYLARPFGAGPYPGVVVIHHMPGWDGPTKEITRRFAHHGYVAICPNLHFREGKPTPEENSASIRAAGGMPDDRTMGDLQGAIDHLRALPYLSGKVGIIGYCSGGRQAYLAACTLRGLDAAVDCYGGGVDARPDELTARQPVAPIDYTKNLQCPLLGLFGVEDTRPSPGHRPDEGRARGGRQDLRVPHLRGRRPRVLRRRSPELSPGGGGGRMEEGLRLVRAAPSLTDPDRRNP